MEAVMAMAWIGGAVLWMATMVVDAILLGFLCFVTAVIVTALLAFWLDRFPCFYVSHQTVVGAGVEGKKKKKKKKTEKKEKSRVVVVEALVQAEEGGVVGFVGEESMVDKVGGLVGKGGNLGQTECFDGGLVVEGGDLKQTECFDGSLVAKGGELVQTECVDGRLVVEGGDSDGSLVVKGSDLEQAKWFGGCLVVEDGGSEQTECLDGRLVVEGVDLEQTECSDDRLVVNGGDLEQTECADGSLVVEGGDLEQTECADGSLVVEGGDLAQTECSDGRLVVQGGHLEQTECSDGKDVVFGNRAADGGCGIEDGEDEEEILPSQGEDDDDEWVGIEKSGLGERFGCLASFMASEAGEALLGTVGSDVRLRLYALHKVAVEGPCYNSPALVLTSSARTKWYKLYFVSLYSVL